MPPFAFRIGTVGFVRPSKLREQRSEGFRPRHQRSRITGIQPAHWRARPHRVRSPGAGVDRGCQDHLPEGATGLRPLRPGFCGLGPLSFLTPFGGLPQLDAVAFGVHDPAELPELRFLDLLIDLAPLLAQRGEESV